MNCEEYRALISCAVDGELHEEELRSLQAHLTVCEDCRAYRDALAALSEELQTPMEAPAELRTRVMGSVRADMRKKKLRRFTRYGSLAACVVLLLSLGLLPKGKGAAKEAEAPMLMQAAGTTESAAAADMWTAESAPAAAPAAPMPEPMPVPEENGEMLYANSFVLPDPETVARDYLWERYGREYGACRVEVFESAGDYTPVLEDYEPVGEITAVAFEGVTVLVDEHLFVFGVIE